MMLVSMVHSSREKQQDTRCTRVKVLQGGRLTTENQMWPSRKSLAVFMKNRLLGRIENKHVGLGEIMQGAVIPVMCFYWLHIWSYLNLFRSISVATGKTLSRLHSPTSTASQELHRK